MKNDSMRPAEGMIAPAAGAMSVEERLNALKEQYENSPEFLLGAEIIDGLEGLGLSAEDMAMLLTRSARPRAMEAISASAGDALATMAIEGRLKRPADAYINSQDFIKLLLELPAEKAVRMFDAQLDSKEAGEKLERERNNAAQDVIEKLKARRELPKQARSAMPASARVDYSTMSSVEFEEAKRRIFGHAGVR